MDAESWATTASRSGYDFRVYREESVAERALGRRSTTSAAAQCSRGSSTTRRSRASARISRRCCSAYPSGGSIDRSADRFNQVMYHGVFVQDDWKVTDKLTAQSRPALRVRGRADRARQSQRARLRSGRGARHHRRGAGRLRAPIRFRRSPASAFRVRGGLQFASDGEPRHLQPGQEQLPAARRLRLSA